MPDGFTTTLDVRGFDFQTPQHPLKTEVTYDYVGFQEKNGPDIWYRSILRELNIGSWIYLDYKDRILWDPILDVVEKSRQTIPDDIPEMIRFSVQEKEPDDFDPNSRLILTSLNKVPLTDDIEGMQILLELPATLAEED